MLMHVSRKFRRARYTLRKWQNIFSTPYYYGFQNIQQNNDLKVYEQNLKCNWISMCPFLSRFLFSTIPYLILKYSGEILILRAIYRFLGGWFHLINWHNSQCCRWAKFFITLNRISFFWLFGCILSLYLNPVSNIGELIYIYIYIYIYQRALNMHFLIFTVA